VEYKKLKKMNTINKPLQETYYILTEGGNYKGHGSIGTKQVLDTIWDITEYTDRDQWLVDMYNDYGIEVEY
jgi:hypothetical protein